MNASGTACLTPDRIEVQNAISRRRCIVEYFRDAIGHDVGAITAFVPWLTGNACLQSTEYDRFADQALEPSLIVFDSSLPTLRRSARRTFRSSF